METERKRVRRRRSKARKGNRIWHDPSHAWRCGTKNEAKKAVLLLRWADTWEMLAFWICSWSTEIARGGNNWEISQISRVDHQNDWTSTTVLESHIEPSWKLGRQEKSEYSEQIMGQGLWQPWAGLQSLTGALMTPDWGEDDLHSVILAGKQQWHWQESTSRSHELEMCGEGEEGWAVHAPSKRSLPGADKIWRWSVASVQNIVLFWGIMPGDICSLFKTEVIALLINSGRFSKL